MRWRAHGSLTNIETAGFSTVFKVKSVTKLPVVELNAVETAKSGSKNRAKRLHFGQAADEEIDITEVPVVIRQSRLIADSKKS